MLVLGVCWCVCWCVCGREGGVVCVAVLVCVWLCWCVCVLLVLVCVLLVLVCVVCPLLRRLRRRRDVPF